MATPTILPGQLRLIVAIAAVHIIAWYAYLSHTPMGLHPTQAENAVVETAFALSKDEAAKDAAVTSYTFALSWPARFVESERVLIFVVRSINALALILATAASAHAAGKYWKRNRPVWIAGLLVGLNPVLVFWAAEISPTMLAVFFTSLGFASLLHWLRHPTPQRSLMIGLLLSIALTLETSLIFLVLLWPMIAGLYPRRHRAYHLGASLVLPAITFLLLSFSSLQLQSPLEMNTTNLGRGIYEVFNSHEAYDGKSFGLHKQLSAFLFLNPIHWGIVFILAAAGAYIRLKNGHKGNSIAALLIFLGVFAASYALNDAGSQTRALLYPIMAIFAGGVSMLPQVWRHAGKPTKWKMLAGLFLIAGVSYSDFYDARSPTNWEADYSYLAKANLRLERNHTAAEWAEKAINLNPERDDMRSIIVHATFNEWALSPSPAPISRETAELELEAARQADASDPDIRAIEAIYLFKLRETDKAVELWKQVADKSVLALICLFWTGNAEKPENAEIESHSNDLYFDLLEKAVDINRNALAYSEGEETLDNMLAFAH